MNRPEADSGRIGPYVVEQAIGAGAHGHVYRAHHIRNPNISVAIKVVPCGGNVDRLLLEPELLSRLNHPGIISLLDYFVEGSDLVMALSFIEGENLDAVLQREGPMSPPAVRSMLVQLALALRHAHAQQILHRDIKLSNIIATPHSHGRRFVLTDFGISRLSHGIQTSKQTAGTWFFMAPEQLRGRPAKQSDLWSLGIVAYRLLTGEYPFQGKNLEELTKAVLYREPTAIRDHIPEFNDPELEQIIRGLIEKQLMERTGSAEDLLKQLGAEDPSGELAESDNAGMRSQDRSQDRSPATFFLREKRRIRRAWVTFWLCSVLMLLPLGPIAGITGLLAILGFYFSHVAKRQATRKSLSILSVVGVLSAARLTSTDGLPNLLIRRLDLNAESRHILEQAFHFILPFYYLALGPVTVYFFAKARRLSRDLKRRILAETDMSRLDSYLVQLRMLVAWHPQDLQLQHRYAESLLAAGQLVDAAVEAQLILENDPWNFGANLLLAQSCFDMGAYRECRAVSERYLSVSGQCFEFTDLRSQCLILEGPADAV